MRTYSMLLRHDIDLYIINSQDFFQRDDTGSWGEIYSAYLHGFLTILIIDVSRAKWISSRAFSWLWACKRHDQFWFWATYMPRTVYRSAGAIYSCCKVVFLIHSFSSVPTHKPFQNSLGIQCGASNKLCWRTNSTKPWWLGKCLGNWTQAF